MKTKELVIALPILGLLGLIGFIAVLFRLGIGKW